MILMTTIKGKFNYIKKCGDYKFKVEGVGNMKIRLYDGFVKFFFNMRYVPDTLVKLTHFEKIIKIECSRRYIGSER